jgi:hypothetical protein
LRFPVKDIDVSDSVAKVRQNFALPNVYFLFLGFSTTALNVSKTGLLSALELTVTVRSCLSIVLLESKVTTMLSFALGITGFLGNSTFVHSHCTSAFVMTNGELPVLVNTKECFTTSP